MTNASTARKASAQATDTPASRSRAQVGPKAPAAPAEAAKKKTLPTAPAKSSLNKLALEAAAIATGEKKSAPWTWAMPSRKVNSFVPVCCSWLPSRTPACARHWHVCRRSRPAVPERPDHSLSGLMTDRIRV